MSHNIHKAAGIIIKNRKLLVERSKGKEFFISPGGSIEDGENARQALVRELLEEFQIEVAEDNLEEFGTFTAEAVGRPGETLLMEVFVVKEWRGEPAPDNEVEDMAWVTSKNEQGLKLGSIFEHHVIPKLKTRDLID